MEAKSKKDGLLEGIRVLDLADEKASFCSKLLADMGASVIKIERPGGDPSRKIGPFLGDSSHPERSLFFFHNNTNKLGITLNLEHIEGKKIFSRLVERADIMVESFPPGYLGELGLDFEMEGETNPKLILFQ
jgi:crotonobetainyl-CoA:carnitine CoA-transferase CaiB-like acyl-CoA transferase